MLPAPITDKQRQQGAVLQAAFEMLEADPGLKIGQAIARAVAKADVEVPQNIQDAMTTSLFKLITGGFPSDVEA